MNRVIFFVFFAGMSLFSMAQKFELSGEFRFRPEFRNGYKQLPDSTTDAAFFVSQRNRIGLHYESEFYEAQLTLQEGRIWGDQLLKSSKSTIGIFEGWVKTNLCKNMSVQFGRQKLSFGNQRMFSENNWSQTAQAHDAAKIEWKKTNKKLIFAQAFNQKAENTFGTDYLNNAAEIKDNYKTLSVLRYEHTLDSLKIAVMGFADGFQDLNGKALYVRSTQGIELTYSGNKFSLYGTGYYQLGHNVAGRSIAAWYASFEAKYKIQKASVLLGGEILSGDDVNSDEYNQFIPQYASNHTFAGSMDYFTSFATHTGGAGLMDLYLKLTWKPSKTDAFALDYHYFGTQQTTLAGGINTDAFLAHEIDLSWKRAVTKDFTVTAGYSVLAGSSTLELIQGRTDAGLAHWAFVMLEFKPTFLKYVFEKKI